MKYLNILKNLFIQPFEGIKEGKEEFESKKKSFILAGIVGGVLTIATFLRLLFNMAKVVTYEFYTGARITKYDWSEIAFKDGFFLFIKVMLIISCLYIIISGVNYLVALLLKRRTKYTRMLFIAVASSIPFLILNMLVSPILGIISNNLQNIVNIISFIYFVIFIVLNYTDELKLVNNTQKLYLTVLSISVQFIIYYIFIALELKSVDSIIYKFIELIGFSGLV